MTKIFMANKMVLVDAKGRVEQYPESHCHVESLEELRDFLAEATQRFIKRRKIPSSTTVQFISRQIQ